MSYCVNCGVELDDSAKSCALCQTPVLNPKKPEKVEAITPFSNDVHMPSGLKRKFFALVASMVMAVPGIVCFLIDLFFFPNITWSPYVVCSLALVWVIFVFPFLTKKFRPYLMWCFNTLAVLLYVYFFFAMDNNTMNWYFKAAMPIILINSVLVLIYMLWAKKKHRHWILKGTHIFFDMGVSVLSVGLLLHYQLGIPYVNSIGIIVFACCIALVGFLSYCYLSKNIRKWLSKNFFI